MKSGCNLKLECLLVPNKNLKYLTPILLREVTPFQTHYFSENLVAPGIEPGPLDL
jgi:hypothetical protein